MNRETDESTIRQIEFELEKAERGMAMSSRSGSARDTFRPIAGLAEVQEPAGACSEAGGGGGLGKGEMAVNPDKPWRLERLEPAR